MCAIRINGLQAAFDQLNRLEQDIKDTINDVLGGVGEDILSDAIAAAPDNLGALKASGGLQRSPDQLSIKIYFSIKYAPYVEFGTGPLTEPPVGYEDYALEFFVSGKGYTPPQPFLFPSVFRHFPEIVPKIQTALQKLANK